MNRTFLEQKLKDNILIIEFRRRTPPIGKIRRMLCTKNASILTSTQGAINLNFRYPKHGGPNFNENEYDLCVVWDILMQDYRLVPANSTRIVREIKPFFWWKYYNDYVFPMSFREKLKFMNK